MMTFVAMMVAIPNSPKYQKKTRKGCLITPPKEVSVKALSVNET
jgi:hypothetical protein